MDTEQNPNALQLATSQLPESLGDQARYAAAIEVLTDLMKGRREVVRAALREHLQAAAAAEGVDGASRKITGLGTLSLSAPEPHVKVADDQALAAWLDDGLPLGAELEPLWVTRTEVGDQLAAASLLALVEKPLGSKATKAELTERAELLAHLASVALANADRWALPEKAAELIEKHPETEVVGPQHREVPGSERPHVIAGYVLHTPTGEVVPGCAVTLATPQVAVKIDKAVRDAELARVRAALGW